MTAHAIDPRAPIGWRLAACRARHRFDPATRRSESSHPPKATITPADFGVEEVFYSTKDGTRVPMFIVHRKHLARDGRTA